MRSASEMRSARANRAAFEEEANGYVAQTDRWPGSVPRKEKTKFHCGELGRRSAAKETFQRWSACSSTRHTILLSVQLKVLQHGHDHLLALLLHGLMPETRWCCRREWWDGSAGKYWC